MILVKFFIQRPQLQWWKQFVKFIIQRPQLQWWTQSRWKEWWQCFIRSSGNQKRRWFGDKSWEIPWSENWDSPTWQKCCPNCTTKTSFSQKTSSLTQFETFCFSMFDLTRCLYLFPTTWPCISWPAFECNVSYLGYKTCKGYTPKQQPCCKGKSDGCIMEKI